MRYLIAMAFGIAIALLTTLYVSSPVASWVVSKFSFESSDDVGTLNDLIFMGVNLAGLIVGWTIGWALGGKLERPEKPI